MNISTILQMKKKKVLKLLENNVKKHLENNNQPSPQAVLAWPHIKLSISMTGTNLLAVTNDIQEVFTRQVKEPQKEKVKNHIFR